MVAVVVSDIGYAAVPSLFVLDRLSGEQITVDAVSALGRGTTLPDTLDHGSSHVRTKNLANDIDPTPSGTRVRARSERVELDVLARLAPGHERLGVVVPQSDRLFQYTVKDPARPVLGRLVVDGATCDIAEGAAWATLDHGRGRWPYTMSWNWRSGSGIVDGRATGLRRREMDRWDRMTENAIVIDGRLTKLGIVASRTHQCFGTWKGSLGELTVDGIYRWVEDVHQRW